MTLTDEEQAALTRFRRTVRDPIACRRDSIGIIDLSAPDGQLVLDVLERALTADLEKA